MKHIYKILLILILIITIAIYFYTNRYETHIVNEPDTNVRIIIINKWTGETFICCGLKWQWKNLGIPKEPYVPRLEDLLKEPKEPTPTN